MSDDDRHRGGWQRLQADLAHVADPDGRPKTDYHGADRLLQALIQAHPERIPQELGSLLAQQHGAQLIAEGE